MLHVHSNRLSSVSALGVAVLFSLAEVACASCIETDTAETAGRSADDSADTGCVIVPYDYCTSLLGPETVVEELAETRFTHSSLCLLFEPLLVTGPAELETIWSECCAGEPVPSIDWDTEGVLCYQSQTAQCGYYEGISGFHENLEDESAIAVALWRGAECVSDCPDTGHVPLTYLWKIPSVDMDSCEHGSYIERSD